MAADKNADEIADRTRKVSGYATAIANRYLAARQKFAIFDGLVRDEINDLFKNSYGSHAYSTLRLTLILDLIRDIWAFIIDPDPRSASLANVWTLVEDNELQNALRKIAIEPRKGEANFTGDGWTDEEKARWRYRWDLEDSERQAKAFDAAFDRLQNHLPKLLASDVAKNLGKARKKAIAHYDMKGTKDGPRLHELGDFGLKWNDPENFLKDATPLLWDAVLLATWGSYATDDFEKRSQLYAADFWARLTGKEPINKI